MQRRIEIGEVTHGMTPDQCERVYKLQIQLTRGSFFFGLTLGAALGVIFMAFGLPFIAWLFHGPHKPY